jgi:hypothetical protein
MTDTPKKTISIIRKPASTGAGDKILSTTTPAGTIQRTGKRIIRREELPQVQRGAQGKPAYKPKPTTANGKPKKPPRKPAPKKQVTPPSDLKARELNDRLNGFHVWLTYQPLALGTEKELFRLVNDEHFPGASKKVVQKVLRMHTNHGLYLQAIQRGGVRFTLGGAEDGEITDYQRQYAGEVIAKRAEGKT